MRDVMLLRTALVAAGLVMTLVALFALVWTVVPGVTYRLFMLSVGAAELSVWVGAVALGGMLLAGVAMRLGSWVAAPFALVAGVTALILAAIPPVQALGVARREGTPLSLGRYVFGFGRTAPLEETRDVVYAAVDGEALRLDVYRPAEENVGTGLPALVVVHGGSWSGGAKGEFRGTSRALAREGLVVFDIDYRLAAPGRHFPLQVADIKCAVGWIKQNAATYGVDPRRVALLGRSAGGHLALLAGYTPGHPDLAPSCAAGDTSVSAVISLYAPIDMLWSYGNPSRPDIIRGPERVRNFLGGTPETMTDRYRLASPHLHVDPATPATLIIHGTRDQIVGIRQAGFLADALSEARRPYRVVELPWGNHGFDFTANGWGSQIAQGAMRQFLASYLGL